MKLIDLHCDTLYEMYKRDCHFDKNELNISLKKAECFDEYKQVLAVWSQNDLSEEECFKQFLSVYEIYKERIPKDFPHVLAVEGGKALGGRIESLKLLYDMGVCFLTLVWAGECSLGGAHDTDIGLTDFGYEVLNGCFELGIIPDISHASDVMFWQVYEEAKKRGKPFVATHSNSRSVHNHRRNLTDEMFCAIKDVQGVVGISLEPTHTSAGEVTVRDICKHILHYISLGGEDNICLGCDLDGVTRNIKDIPDISHLPKLYEALRAEGVDADKIFYNNANNFLIRNVKI
ncbi:MAG: membrane dipeptidase [Clostridia bacterium]|nr:membrane dipeptidase [Clostridia bacterium]